MLARDVPLNRWFLFWGIALGGAAFDLTTKAFVFNRFSLHQRYSVLDGILEVQPSVNPGALWGLGSWLPQSGLIFAALSIIAALAIWYYLFVRGAARDAAITAALGLIMAGALGNCFDRLTLGHVRDFVYFHVDAINFSCAIFNFADNMLVVGALALMLLALRPEKVQAEPAAIETGQVKQEVSTDPSDAPTADHPTQPLTQSGGGPIML
jgi:signal peptidase II